MNNFFGTIYSSTQLHEYQKTINSLFSKLTDKKKKYCQIVVDEIHIKPTIRYQENNIICYSHHKPSKPARTVLAIMIASIMRATVFVRGLIPVHSVKCELLFDQTSKL